MKEFLKGLIIGAIVIGLVAFSRTLYKRAKEKTDPIPLETPNAIEEYQKKVTDTALALARSDAQEILKRWKDRFGKKSI